MSKAERADNDITHRACLWRSLGWCLDLRGLPSRTVRWLWSAQQPDGFLSCRRNRQRFGCQSFMTQHTLGSDTHSLDALWYGEFRPLAYAICTPTLTHLLPLRREAVKETTTAIVKPSKFCLRNCGLVSLVLGKTSKFHQSCRSRKAACDHMMHRCLGFPVS